MQKAPILWRRDRLHTPVFLGFPCSSAGKESAHTVGDVGSIVQSLGWEDPPEKGKATHSSILAWRILWTEEPGRLQSWQGHKELDTIEWLSMHITISLGYIPRIGIAASTGDSVFNTWENYQIVFQSGLTILPSLQPRMKVPSSHPHQRLSEPVFLLQPSQRLCSDNHGMDFCFPDG